MAPAHTDVVVWSRMQMESGEDLQSIIRSKELQRVAGGGLFCWGVGNAPARSIQELARRGVDIDVVFSMMRSPPQAKDAAPSRTMVWLSYFDLDGIERPLPAGSLVRSRAGDAAPKTVHYALMCRSDAPLAFGDFGPFDPLAYRNVSAGGKVPGASQVTALLRCVAPGRPDTGYRINLRAKLTGSYWVKLGHPLVERPGI